MLRLELSGRHAILKRARAAAAGLCGLLVAGPLSAQTRLQQDALDNLQSRSNVVQGVGARAFGMGGAFIARPDDATAASWNPAGLSYLRLPEFSAVGTHTSLEIRQVLGDFLTRNDKLTSSAPDFLAATYPVSLGTVTGAVQLSFQRVISFDGARRIENYDAGHGTEPVRIRQYEQFGGFDVIAFGTGFQVKRGLRAGVALNRWFNGYNYTAERQSQRPSQQTTDFGFSGWNANVGLIYSPIEALNFGAVYKSGFTAEVDLNRSRIDAATATQPATTNSYRRQTVSLDFPAALGLGASWRPKTPLTVSADYTRTRWSQARIYQYFTLPATPPAPPLLPEDSFDSLLYPVLVPGLEQIDTQQIRVGAEYVIIKQRVKWPVRAGYFVDRQLFKAFDEVTGLRNQTPLFHGFTVGTGIIVGNVLLDVAYVYEKGTYREADPEALPDDRQLFDNAVRSKRFLVSLIYRHKR